MSLSWLLEFCTLTEADVFGFFQKKRICVPTLSYVLLYVSCCCCAPYAVFFLCAHPAAAPAIVTITASDGRLYRCDVNTGLSNGTLSRITASTTKDDVSDDWQEHEASRTHSVKFTDPQDQENKEVCFFYINIWVGF